MTNGYGGTMSVRITLTDEVFPPSSDFIDFLQQWISNEPFDGTSWAEFGRERVRTLGRSTSSHLVLHKADTLIDGDGGRRYLSRAYELFVALLIGDVAPLQALQDRFRFFLVVGIPRSGGKYLTKQVFRALGHDPTAVPEVLGHDAFPDAGPWRFGESGNGWVSSLQTVAEYLTMVEIFFGGASPHGGTIVVPKKMTKAPYAAGLFRSAFGASTEAIVTVRHPAPCCISTYETAGGLPADGRFAARGNVEKFCARELRDLGFSREEIQAMDYFDAYLHYWENYHVRLAMGISTIARTCEVLAYGAERYTGRARQLVERFGTSEVSIEPFHVQDRASAHPDWLEKAEPSVRRVAEQWDRVGLEFPIADVNAAW
jgi:hypothetical protein